MLVKVIDGLTNNNLPEGLLPIKKTMLQTLAVFGANKKHRQTIQALGADNLIKLAI